MNRYVVLAGALATMAVNGHAQILFTGSYTNNFDSLGASGTSLDSDWSALRYAGSGAVGAALSPTPGSGTSGTGGLYNVGTAGDSDRALGSLASGTTVPRFGVRFQNSTGGTISHFQLDGVMEQWRSGGSVAANEVLVFEYSFDAADINDGAATWVAGPDFDLNEKLTTTTASAAVDGNAAANQIELSSLVTGFSWGDGGVLTLRWSDADNTGSNGLYALDNFGLAVVPEPSTWAVLGLGLAALAGWRTRRKIGA